MTVGLIEFSAVAGLVGGGGLGDLAMTYGYQRFDTSVMFVTVVLLIILVQLAQNLGNYFAKVFTQIIKGRGEKRMKKILAFALSAIVGVSALSGCSVETQGRSERKVVRVGVTGTDGDAWEILKRKAEKKELKLNWLSSLITQRQIKR